MTAARDLDELLADLLAWPKLDGTERALVMFSVYAYPLDFPRHWVVRRSFVLTTGELVHDVVPRLALTLDAARELIPEGLFCQPRHPDDEPHIVEAWF